jgi:hypothetical protein
MRALTLLLTLLVFVQPLSAQRSEKKCRETPIDSTTPSSPVYRDCHTDHAAKVRGTPARIDWQPDRSETRDGACFVAEFEYVVDTTGVPDLSTLHMRRSTNPGFSDAVRTRIATLRFTPAERDGRPVRQLVEWREKAGMRVVVSSFPGGGAPRSRPPNC